MRKCLKKHSNISTFKNFASWNSNLGKWEPTWEILKAQIRKSTIQLAKIFVACENTSKHTCAISQVHFPFLQAANQLRNQVAKWGNLRINLRIPGNLRKCQPSFKFLFKHLIISFFISHSHFNLQKSPPSCEAQKFQRIPSIGSLEVMRLKRNTSVHLVEQKLSDSSPFLPWPR